MASKTLTPEYQEVTGDTRCSSDHSGRGVRIAHELEVERTHLTKGVWGLVPSGSRAEPWPSYAATANRYSPARTTSIGAP